MEKNIDKNFVTPEYVYSLFHRYCTFASKGVWPRIIKNFDKQRTNSNWIYFERCAHRVNSNKHIDVEFLIQALSKNFKGWFNPQYLVSMKGIKIYRLYVDRMSRISDLDSIVDLVFLNFKNVVKYCNENNIEKLNDYFNENVQLCPTFALHLYSGKISKYFLALFPKNMFLGLTNDVSDIYLTDFITSYDETRKFILKSIKLRKLSDNIDILFKKALKSIKNV